MIQKADDQVLPPITLSLKQVSCWSPSCPFWYLPCVWLNPFSGLLFKRESVGGPLALERFQTSLQTDDPSAAPCLQPVTWCLSVTEPVKGEIVIPAG